MQISLVAHYPMLAEFPYIKMIAVLMIDESINKWRSKGEVPLAEATVHYKKANINTARDHFVDGDYLAFVNTYNLLNQYSLVACPTAYHNDNFNQLSLENKLLLVDYLFSVRLQIQRRVIRWQPLLFCPP